MKTIENAKEFEDVIPREEVETRPRYNFDFNRNEKLEQQETDKTEFDDIIEEKELRPIVKTILENNEDKVQERDYIVEDVSTGLFTEQTPPTGSDWHAWKLETDVTSTSTSTTSAPATTYDTIPTTSDQWLAKTSPSSTTERGQYERFVTVPVLSITSSNNEPVKVRLKFP